MLSIMIVMDKVKIEISKEAWLELNKRKQPGDSFDTVILNLIKEVEK